MSNVHDFKSKVAKIIFPKTYFCISNALQSLRCADTEVDFQIILKSNSDESKVLPIIINSFDIRLQKSPAQMSLKARRRDVLRRVTTPFRRPLQPASPHGLQRRRGGTASVPAHRVISREFMTYGAHNNNNNDDDENNNNKHRVIRR